jgi:anti-sigma regulatory factor (Ser/Thr protein kinase)
MKRESWLPAVPETAPVARALVREAATECGIDGNGVWELMLATTEAVANAIQHGGACSRYGGAIRLRIESSDEGLIVEVCDCGEFQVRPEPVDLEATRGRGIPLIAAVVDHLELRPDEEQTRVRFVKSPHAA